MITWSGLIGLYVCLAIFALFFCIACGKQAK